MYFISFVSSFLDTFPSLLFYLLLLLLLLFYFFSFLRLFFFLCWYLPIPLLILLIFFYFSFSRYLPFPLFILLIFILFSTSLASSFVDIFPFPPLIFLIIFLYFLYVFLSLYLPFLLLPLLEQKSQYPVNISRFLLRLLLREKPECLIDSQLPIFLLGVWRFSSLWRVPIPRSFFSSLSFIFPPFPSPPLLFVLMIPFCLFQSLEIVLFQPVDVCMERFIFVYISSNGYF